MKPTDFRSLNLSKALLKAIAESGYSEMTPIQAASIPAILSGSDIVAQSKTGSGKTVAFALPILQKIATSQMKVQALILCPTRELSQQVISECQKLARYLSQFRAISLVGGQPASTQIQALDKGVHLVVGTPGRTLELLRSGKLDVTKLKVLVLDEADRLLEDSFAEEIKAILAELPQSRQTIFFSATFPESIEELSRLHQRSAKRIAIATPSQEAVTIQQYLYAAEKPEKIETLLKILEKHPSTCTLIFCRTKAAVDEIGKVLGQKNSSVRTLHADLPQKERDATTKLFRDGKLSILVATDVAARGLDIDALALVINFDLPSSPEIYIHRIGRTGRAGRSGTAVSFVTAYEETLISEIEAMTGVKLIRSDKT